MCGIIGYSGYRPAIPVVIEGLHHLEYRGYDSAGVASVQQGRFRIVRARGKLSALEDLLSKEPPSTATTGMGHTRWATHGEPAVRNAHPQMSNDGTLAIVHNGIIENYLEIKADLESKGYTFSSETDTEVLVNLVQECRKSEPDLLKAFSKALSMAHGAYAVCLMSQEDPDTFYAARLSAPLIMGVGTGEFFVASDIPAFLQYTRQVVFLEDGELVKVDHGGYQIFTIGGLKPVTHQVMTIKWDMQSAQKGGYRHFMLKEIFEQPRVIVDGLTGRVDPEEGSVRLRELDSLNVPERLHIVACGTSYHAGLWGRYLIENWAQIPVQVEIASEFRYRDRLLLGKKDMSSARAVRRPIPWPPCASRKRTACPCSGSATSSAPPSPARRIPSSIPRPVPKSAWRPPKPCAARCSCSASWPSTGASAGASRTPDSESRSYAPFWICPENWKKPCPICMRRPGSFPASTQGRKTSSTWAAATAIPWLSRAPSS